MNVCMTCERFSFTIYNKSMPYLMQLRDIGRILFMEWRIALLRRREITTIVIFLMINNANVHVYEKKGTPLIF